MGIIITNEIALSNGLNLSNVYCNVVFRTQGIPGTIPCDLNFYVSEESSNNISNKVYPVVNGKMILNCNVDILIDDVIKQSGVSKVSDMIAYFFKKVKDELTVEYGWTITINN